jgi:hypothetical protein
MEMGLNATEAHQQARPGDAVIGWTLGRSQREDLLRRFPPRYREVVADHVTLSAKVAPDSALPNEEAGKIVGRADDGRGVEAMVVRLGGTTDRPDGSTYHITWSLAPGRTAKESNDVIATYGWKAIDPPVPIRLQPARFP